MKTKEETRKEIEKWLTEYLTQPLKPLHFGQVVTTITDYLEYARPTIEGKEESGLSTWEMFLELVVDKIMVASTTLDKIVVLKNLFEDLKMLGKEFGSPAPPSAIRDRERG